MAALRLPSGLEWLVESEDGRDWMAGLPTALEQSAEQWNLELGPPFTGSSTSLVLPARRSDDSAAVLKLQFPDRDSEHEAHALTHWAGEGAARLLEHDAERHALLLERCRPGSPLSGVEIEPALDVLIELLPRLWQPAGAPFRPLAEEARDWADGLGAEWHRWGRPFERRLLDAALEALRGLPGSQGEQVLVNQDLHGDNILRAQREPWLVIDPKPLIGEREFGLAPILRSRELGSTSRRDLGYRLDRLTGELDLDRERSRLWALAQTLAWSFGADAVMGHLETAAHLADLG